MSNPGIAEFAELVAQLGSGSDGERAQAAYALGRLAHGNDAAKAEIRRQGGIEALVALVRGGGAEAQEKAALTLARLAQGNATSQVAIAGAGGREALEALAHDGSGQAQVNATRALKHIPAAAAAAPAPAASAAPPQPPPPPAPAPAPAPAHAAAAISSKAAAAAKLDAALAAANAQLIELALHEATQAGVDSGKLTQAVFQLSALQAPPPPHPQRQPAPTSQPSPAPLPSTTPTQPASVQEQVQSLQRPALVEVLETLGVPANTRTEAQLRERLIELVEPHADGWEAALTAARRRIVENFLKEHRADHEAGKRLAVADRDGNYVAMWAALVKEFCPPAPSAPDRRGKKVLVLGPGFGFQANEEQVKIIERAGFDVYRLWNPAIVPSPEGAGFSMRKQLPLLLEEIDKYKPDAILCASKGGAYMAELWTLMEAGKLPKYPSLMINAHPSVTKLPQDVKIILVQGSNEEVWPKPRGYDGHGKVESGSLEALIRTGSPKLCYLYHTIEKPGLRKREGDTHIPASLLKYDCLPRLVDALLSESPPFTFPASCGVFTSADRRQHEIFLGFDPRSIRRFWASKGGKGMDDSMRFRVPTASDEFKAVEGMFKSEPSVQRFYKPRSNTASKDIEYIERIENGYLHENMDTGYETVKKKLLNVGCPYENGVHARWLFHGAGSKDVVQMIVEDPDNGFKPWLNERGLWGQGVYFARDAVYSVECPGCCDNCIDDEGNQMLMLCLVQTGLPVVGEEHIKDAPKVHEGMRPKISYDTFIDCPSNPEMFVTPQGKALAYPAYVIHFS